MQPISPTNPFSTLLSSLAAMWSWLVNPPETLTDITQRRQAQLSAAMSMIIFIANVVGIVAALDPKAPFEAKNLVRVGLGLILLLGYFLSRTRVYHFGALLLSLGFSATGYALILTNPNIQSANVSGSIYATIPFALIIGSALLTSWGMFFLIFVNTGLIFILPRLINVYSFQEAGTNAGIISSIGVLLLIIVAYRNSTEQQRLKEIQTSTDDLQLANNELNEIRANLEERIKERTSELETITTRLSKRAGELQAVAQVGRAITSIQNLDELLPKITEMINEQFNFYHVGIFLLNDNKEFAVLRATNSIGGQKMLGREHKLRVGELGIVGNVAASGYPRIALNTGDDPVFFDNPDLPTTQSEMALPIKIGNEIIGVLDVQSEQPSAFVAEDVNLLTILADQVSIAIRNASSFDNAQKALAEAERISSQYLRSEWRNISNSVKNAGFRYSVTGMKALEKPIDSADIIHAAKSGENVLVDGENGRKLTIPIKLRGQVMGVVNVQIPAGRNWNQAELDITQSIADRVALAIENARLFEDAQRRASRELAISEISTKITSSIQVEAILRTAAEELSHALRGSEVLVQLESGLSKEIKE